MNVYRILYSRVLHYSRLLDKAPMKIRVAVFGGTGLVVGATTEVFMQVTGFYKINAAIQARRYLEQEEKKFDLDETLEELTKQSFRKQLERRSKYTGETEEEIDALLNMKDKIPSLYESIKENVYPSEKGWGVFTAQGTFKEEVS